MPLYVPDYIASVSGEYIARVVGSPKLFAEIVDTYSFAAEKYISKMSEN